MNVHRNVQLSELTTIRTGGKVNYFVEVTSIDELKESIRLSRRLMLPLKFLGGGSNIIFPDAYLDMLVVKISMKGISFLENKSQVKAMAGENWDNFVKLCVNHGGQGKDSQTGIPGS